MPRGRPRKNVVADSPPSANSDSDNAATPGQQMGSDDERLSVASPAPVPRMPARGRGRPRKHFRQGQTGRLNDLLNLDGDDSAATTRDTTPANNDGDASDDDGEVEGNGGRARRAVKVIQGKEYAIASDELKLDDDPKGDTKVDANGNLLGGRTYMITSFTSVHRENPNQQWFLAIEAARALGFRDSLKFFIRNPLLYKVNAHHLEKEQLISEGRIHPNLRARGVALISARNAFKIFGAKFVRNGKYVDDDYYEDASIAAGNERGASATVPTFDEKEAAKALTKDPLDRPSIRSLLGGAGRSDTAPRDISSIGLGMDKSDRTQFGGAGHAPYAKWDVAAKQRKPGAHLTEKNWCLEYARAVRDANKQINMWRRDSMIEVSLYAGHVRSSLNGKRDADGGATLPDSPRKKAKLAGIEANPTDNMDIDTSLTSIEPTSSDNKEKAKAEDQLDQVPETGKRADPLGAMEAQTNVAHVPRYTQPTASSWEQVSEYPVIDDDHPIQTGSKAARNSKLYSVDFVSANLYLPGSISDEVADMTDKRAYASPYAWDFCVDQVIKEGVIENRS